MLLPLIIFPGLPDPIRASKALALILFASALFSHHLWKKIDPSVGVFFFYVSLSALFSGFAVSFQFTEWAYIAVTLYVATVVAGFRLFEIKCVLGAIMWGCLLSAAYAYVQLFGADFIFTKITSENVPFGFVGQHTLLGPFLATGFVIAIFYRVWWAAIFLLAPILLTRSSFTYLSLAAGVFVFGIHVIGFRKALLGALTSAAVLIFALLQFPEYLHSSGRFEIWKNIIASTIKDGPVFGHGMGTYAYYAHRIFNCVDEVQQAGCETVFQSNLSLRMNGFFAQAHSDPLQLFHDGGIVGILLALWVLIVFVRRAALYFNYREIAASAAVATVILVNSLGNFPMRLVPQSTICVLTLIIVITFRKGEYRL